MEDAAEQAVIVASPIDGNTTIHVVSQRFGTFDVPAASVLHFAHGLIGFPVDHRFVILDHEPGSPFKWMLSLDNGEERPVTDFSSRRGSVGGAGALTSDGEYLYFTWEESLGDIWVMDVVTEDS